MANKKYTDFPAGNYDKSKILLQADPVTGALQKINLPDANLFLKAPNNVLSADGSLDINSHKYYISDNASAGDLSLTLNADSGTPSIILSADSGAGYQVSEILGPDGFSVLVDIDVDSSKFSSDGYSISMTQSTASSVAITLIPNEARVLGPLLNILTSATQLHNLPTYASNAAAQAAGLPTTTLYRQGDLVAIVH